MVSVAAVPRSAQFSLTSSAAAAAAGHHQPPAQPAWSIVTGQSTRRHTRNTISLPYSCAKPLHHSPYLPRLWKTAGPSFQWSAALSSAEITWLLCTLQHTQKRWIKKWKHWSEMVKGARTRWNPNLPFFSFIARPRLSLYYHPPPPCPPSTPTIGMSFNWIKSVGKCWLTWELQILFHLTQIVLEEYIWTQTPVRTFSVSQADGCVMRLMTCVWLYWTLPADASVELPTDRGQRNPNNKDAEFCISGFRNGSQFYD